MSGRLFVGPGVRNWVKCRELGVDWITSPPLGGKPSYPPFLDLVEAVRRALPVPWSLFETAARALAPSWEELNEAGLDPDRPRLPSAKELGASDEAPIVQSFLTCGLAQVLARLPDQFGVLIRSSELWDMTSLEFLSRLLREPSRRFPVAIETSHLPPCSPVIARLARGAELVPGKGVRRAFVVGAADRLIAVCSHGLPKAVLSALGLGEPAAAERFSWPSGGEGFVMSPSRAARVRKGLPPDGRRMLHAAIFDNHPISGWDYIRRSGHAVASGDAQRLARQHTACVAGLTNVGYDFVYQHLSALAAVLPRIEAIAAHIGSARLSPRLWGRGGRKRAVYHYRCALHALGDSEVAVPIMQELANLYATTRTPSALRKARSWYQVAFSALGRIGDAQERRNVEIRLCNGLALVEYHEGHDLGALNHEQRAMDLIAASAPSDRRTALWAEPLIRTNTAKLLIKRFNDAEGAITLLRSLLDSPDERVRRNCSQNLGRAYFDKGDYAGVITHLSSHVESADFSELSESEELYDRFVFTLSLLALGDLPRAAQQLPRMRYLADVNAMEAAQDAIRRLENVSALS